MQWLSDSQSAIHNFAKNYKEEPSLSSLNFPPQTFLLLFQACDIPSLGMVDALFTYTYIHSLMLSLALSFVCLPSLPRMWHPKAKKIASLDLDSIPFLFLSFAGLEALSMRVVGGATRVFVLCINPAYR